MALTQFIVNSVMSKAVLSGTNTAFNASVMNTAAERGRNTAYSAQFYEHSST